MANYSTLLKSWGSTGAEYPNSYSYLEGEQPVDAWDNFITHNIIEDIQHLLDLTNDRIETDKGASGNEPTSPEAAHLYNDTDNERLEYYDTAATTWHGLMKVDGDTMEGALDMGGFGISAVGSLSLTGDADVAGNSISDSTAAETVYDAVNQYVPLSVLEQTQVTLTAGTHLSGGGTATLGGSLSVDVDDDFVLNTGDSITGELVGSQVEGSRIFTSKNSTSGDQFTVRSTTGGAFELAGYDSSAGVWKNSSTLSYDPQTEDWSFGSLPNVNGENVATQPWADANLVNIEDTEITEQDGGSVGFNTFVPIGTFGLDDTEQLYVTRATLTKNGFDLPCESGVNLTIAVSNGDTVQVLSGDGTTMYDGEEGSPLAQYTNTTGGHVSVAIGIDNGHYGVGFGDDVGAHAGFSVRKY